MNKLNDDMQHAIDNMSMSNVDKKFVEELLYQERINKNKEWANDAVSSIKELLNNVKTEEIDD